MNRSWLDLCFWMVLFAFEAWRVVTRLKFWRWRRRSSRSLAHSSASTLALLVGAEGCDSSEGGASSVNGGDIRLRVVVGVIESFYGGFLGWWWPKFCIEGIGRVNVGVRECRVRWAC